MLIHIIAFIIFLYLFFRAVLPLKVRPTIKAVLALILLVASQQHLISRLLFGSLASPEQPALLLMFQGWLFVSLLFLFLLNVARDVVALFARVLRDSKTPRKRFSPERRQALLVMAATIPAAYGVSRAVAVPEVRTYSTAFKDLPRGLNGLNIVQISDMHISPLLQRNWAEKVVRKVNDLNPDLILFTGDTVDGTPAIRMNDVAPLKELRSRYGIFGCTGNHEYYGGFNQWMQAFERLGIQMLLNSHTRLSINGSDLVLTGVTDVAAARYGLPLPDLEAAMPDTGDDDAFRILLEHRPGNAQKNARKGFDLQLSGHTHGGQIVGMDSLVSRFNSKFVYGWYYVGGMRLYVSSGAGLWNGFPVRLGVPSEIARFVLSSEHTPQ